MLPYDSRLKSNSRVLRSKMTDAEQKLWHRLRRKQINGWQFYRQKPLGRYIVDFYCAAAQLVIEINGSQHYEPQHQQADRMRDEYLAGLGLRVLRFDNRQVLLEMEAVVECISKIPPAPLFQRGVDSPPVVSPDSTLQANPVLSFDDESLPSISPVPNFDDDSLPSTSPVPNLDDDSLPSTKKYPTWDEGG